MKNYKFLLLTATIVALSSCMSKNESNAPSSNIVIENEQFRLIVGNDAIPRSLIVKSTNEECLMQGEEIALFSVTQERPYHNEIKLAHPNKKTLFQADTLYKEGDKLIVGFELIPYKAVIRLRETPSYIGFNLDGFIVDEGTYPAYLKITPPPATEVCMVQLPIRNREKFGEWLNVCWDDKAAINVLATDQHANIDFEKRKGYHILRASAIKEIKFNGTGAALIACQPDKLLDNIAQLEEDFNLPRGVKSRRSNLINASYYWTANVNPSNVDEHIKYAKQGGFRTMSIYYSAFEVGGGYNTIGSYEIDRTRYPNGKEDLTKMLNKIKAAGITPGVHFLHCHIGRDSEYVTPIPDHRINILNHFNLSRNLGLNDTILYVEQNPEGTVMADGCRVLKVGTEFISYSNFTTTPPYQFTGCIRGVDKTTVNSFPKGGNIGLVDVSEFGATSLYIDQRTSLQDEVAVKIANIYDAGFQFIYFDGSEGVNPPFGINVAAAQYKVFKQLQPQPVFAEGAAKSHFSWHMLSGGNAFDVFSPETLKEETRLWPATEAPRMQQDFTRINFGWLGYWLPSETTVGTQPDQLEFVTSVAAAFDCPISIQSNIQAFEAHPRTADNLEVMRRWEEVRACKWLTETQKKMLQNLHQEHTLLINEQKEFELLPYDQIINVANNNREIRAFVFERKNEYYVVYWHISASKKLQLPIASAQIKLYKELGEEVQVSSGQDNATTIPADCRRYLKINGLTKDQIIEAFGNAKTME